MAKNQGTISINKINGIECTIEYKKIIDEYGEKTRDILKEISPKNSRFERTTPYYAGWVFEIDKKRDDNYGGRVWNKTNYQLTHLLENGHLIVNKIGGVGWASPHPHIHDAYQRIKSPFENDIKNVDIKTTFK